MFGRGLESLLGQERNIEIVGQQADVEQAIAQIKQLQPDVVILDSDDPSHSLTPVLLYRILKQHSGVKVVGLSLQNNRFYVYGAMQGVVNDVADLLKAIS